MIKRVRGALTDLVLVLLALVIGAMPASAGQLVGGEPGTSAFVFGPLQIAPPTGLTAQVVSSSEIDLSWTAPSGIPAASYNVYQGTSAGGEDTSTPLNSNPINGTTYQVTSLSSSTTYYFEVTAVDRGGNESGYSGEVSATTATPGTIGGSGGTSSPLWPVIAGLAVVGGAAAGALWTWRRRRSRSAARLDTPAGPGTHTAAQPHIHSPAGPGTHTAAQPHIHAAAGPAIQVVPHADPPPVISIHATGTDPTHTVQFVPHPGTSLITTEEAPRQ